MKMTRIRIEIFFFNPANQSFMSLQAVADFLTHDLRQQFTDVSNLQLQVFLSARLCYMILL